MKIDIDYKDFMKIYRECTKEPYSFLTIDTTLPASDLLTLFRIGFFRAAHGWRGLGKKDPPSLQSVTHILQ